MGNELVVGGVDLSAFIAGDDLSPCTYAARRLGTRHLATFLRERGLSLLELQEDDVEAFRGWCKARGWALHTVNLHLSTLRVLVRRLVRAGVMDRDVAKEVGGYRTGDLSPYPALTTAQARELVATTDTDPTPRGVRDRALLRLGLRTGLRKAEILALTPAHFMEYHGHPAALVGVKGGAMHRIKLTPVIADLRAWTELAGELTGASSSELEIAPFGRGVCPAGDGWRLTPRMAARSFDRMVAKRGRQARLPFELTPHSLRSTFITLALRSAPLHRVQRAVGHRDPRTTQRYDQARDDLDDHPTDYLAGI